MCCLLLAFAQQQLCRCACVCLCVCVCACCIANTLTPRTRDATSCSRALGFVVVDTRSYVAHRISYYTHSDDSHLSSDRACVCVRCTSVRVCVCAATPLAQQSPRRRHSSLCSAAGVAIPAEQPRVQFSAQRLSGRSYRAACISNNNCTVSCACSRLLLMLLLRGREP